MHHETERAFSLENTSTHYGCIRSWLHEGYLKCRRIGMNNKVFLEADVTSQDNCSSK